MRIKQSLLLLSFILVSTNSLLAQHWLTNFAEAKQEAGQNKKPIILVFQGSDWCAPCMKLDRKIWQSDTFKNYAKQHYVMLKADFPRKKKNQLSKAQQAHNNSLAEKYNPQGHFPLVVIMDHLGKTLGVTGYKKMTVKEYIKLINSFIPQSK